MLSDDRYCVYVLLQVAAVRAAIGEVGKVVLTNYVQTLSNRRHKEQRLEGSTCEA